MHRLLHSLRFALSGALLCLAAVGRAQTQGYNDEAYGSDQGSYQQFYDDLSPYGEWVNDPQYGYVWVPDAGNDFRPYYTNGYWVNSEYGNTWVSNYSWGWAPFHYGRWSYSDYYGWLWVPGNQWGPAWVSWRSGGGSYGWAPMGPGVSINIAIGNSYYVPDYWWTFTPQQYILNPGFHNYSYGPRYNQQYLHQTTIINNTYVHNHNTYIAGPRRQEMEHAIGRPVQQVAISNSHRPEGTHLQGNSLSIYRPAIADNHPRATERPRTFSPARQPVSEVPATPRQSGIDRGAIQQQQSYGHGQGGTIQQQAPAQQQQPVSQQPARTGWGNRPPEPRQERPRLDPVMQVPQQQQQPVRSFERPQQQAAQPSRGWNNNNGNSAPQQTQQQPQPQPQRIDRPAYNRNAEVQRPQMAQPVQRPQPTMQQPVQRPQSAPALPQAERPQQGGGGGANDRFNRR